MNLKTAFLGQLERSYPGLKNVSLENLLSENLLSPFRVELPTAARMQIEEIIAAVFRLRESAAYLQHYEGEILRAGLKDPGNKSIMMSYDFHVDAEGDMKLIEINTNASFLLLGMEMYELHGLPAPQPGFTKDDIRKMILNELKLQGKELSSPRVVITDRDPEQQRLYIEFLTYRELFRTFGWDSEIRDFRALATTTRLDFVYNRHTDFMLTEPESAWMREKFLNRECCFSPNPFEYFLLADKQRLIDWSVPGFFEGRGVGDGDLQTLRRMLPAARDLTAETRDELWSERKKYFFKPKRAFGAKQSYKGSSISRKHFDDLCGGEMIAQEYIPAPEKTFVTPEGEQSFKYDLRCYAYEGRLQSVVARLYQGQVTNLRTPYGGFAPVLFH